MELSYVVLVLFGRERKKSEGETLQQIFTKYRLIVSWKIVTFCVWKRWREEEKWKKSLIFLETIHKFLA